MEVREREKHGDLIFIKGYYSGSSFRMRHEKSCGIQEIDESSCLAEMGVKSKKTGIIYLMPQMKGNQNFEWQIPLKLLLKNYHLTSVSSFLNAI